MGHFVIWTFFNNYLATYHQTVPSFHTTWLHQWLSWTAAGWQVSWTTDWRYHMADGTLGPEPTDKQWQWTMVLVLSQSTM